MTALKYLAALYSTGALIVALRLGYHMVFRLDEHDWACCRGSIWSNLWISTALWPVFLWKPVTLLDPGGLFDCYGQAERRRQALLLQQSPPPCGREVKFSQPDGLSGFAAGVFTFSSSGVQACLEAMIRSDPVYAAADYLAMLRWVCGRDESREEPTEVPALWSRFEFVATRLLRDHQGRVFCKDCASEYAASELKWVDQELGEMGGWIVDRIDCPEGHRLLDVEVLHLSF